MRYDDIKNTLQMLSDPVEKLEAVMEFGRMLDSVPDGALCNEIIGCASHVEICRVGNRFYGRADSAMVRGIVAILTAMVDGKTPQQIKNMDLTAEFAALNIALGAGRLGGVNSMIRFLQNL